jgi:hypothetical protein
MSDQNTEAAAGSGYAGPACSEILITPIKVAVHRKDDNPIFGENVIHVSVDDEAAGPFIVLESNAGHADGLRIDQDELEAAVVAARQLIAGFQNPKGERPKTRSEDA